MEFIDNITPTFDQYLPTQLEAQNRWMVGKNTRTADNYNQWAQLYYPNAFQVAMLNYQNEYEHPLQQMLRYQQAGLNQYAFQPSQSASGSQGSKPGSELPRQQLNQQKISNALKAVSTVSQAMSVAQEIYDYINFGKGISENNLLMTQYNSEAAYYKALEASSNAKWTQFWNEGVDNGTEVGTLISDSPRAKYMQSSTNRINAQISQLNALVDIIYPSQSAANSARAALNLYQKELMQGNYDAILKINTGNATLDAIFKMLALKLLQNL